MSSHSSSKLQIIVTMLAIALLIAIAAAATYWLWPAPNSLARRQVGNILLSDATPAEILTELEPYVKLNDFSLSVAKRLSPTPDQAKEQIRATRLSYGLDGVNLELAIRPDGRIAGIGRFIHGSKGGIEWFVQPESDWTRGQTPKQQ
ncbi:MAG: hypothetical protein JW809_12685 [Pirellulales bacterium]|nr:hypothetical protein [Pirellulales bacterium]